MTVRLAVPKRLQGLNDTHERSKGHERRIAKELGARQTSASGSKHEKGDVRLVGFARVECKNTTSEGYRVTTRDIRVLESATMTNGEIPFMHVELEVGPDGKPGCTFCVVPEGFLDVIKEMAAEFNRRKNE